ncbi:hypothetical protein ACLB2K_038497 [Fragaria x ananassa]
MEPLALKLEILKGPRKGETLEYRPGSKIRIGRVVRGNNLPIKDSGISTNHLVIDSESGQWMVRDLDSSNGTIVNDTALNPNTPFELSDGDEIKIGEYTSISVKIDGHKEASRLRRNPRRTAVGKVGAEAANRGRRGRFAAESEVVQVEVKSENHEEIGGGEDRVPARRGRVRKKIEVESDLEEIEVVEKPRRGRGRPKKAMVLKSEEDVVDEVAVPEVSSRAATRSKIVVLESENCSVECEQVKIEPKRRGRKRKNVQEEQLVCEKGNAVAVEKDLGVAVPVGVSCDNDVKGDVPEQKDSGEIGPVNDGDANELNLGNEPKRRDRNRKNVQQEQLVCGTGNAVVSEQKNLGEIGPVDDDDDKGLNVIDNEKAKESNLGHEEAAVDFGMGESGNISEKAKESNEEAATDCNVGEGDDKVESGSRSCSGASSSKDVDKKGSGSGIKEGLGKVWQEQPDLEKMTLDDWFDYVEVSWPRVVNDEINKICAGMREKARLVQEHIAQHKKEKVQSEGGATAALPHPCNVELNLSSSTSEN